MSSLVSPSNAQPVFSSRAYASPGMVPHPLGTIGKDAFGRTYRFVRAGASDLVVGNALQAQAELTNHQAMTPAAAAIGDTSITVTPGATGGAADLYAGGIAVIDTTPGEGYSYPVKTHLAISSSTAFVLQLARGWTVRVALTTSSRVNLYSNPYRGVIQQPTTISNVPVGVCQFILTATEYGWIGASGQFGTLIQGTPGVGLGVGTPGSAAGAVCIHAVATIALVGNIMETGVDGKIQAVKWTLG